MAAAEDYLRRSTASSGERQRQIEKGLATILQKQIQGIEEQRRIVAAAGRSGHGLRIDRTGLVGTEDLAEIVVEVPIVKNS